MKNYLKELKGVRASLTKLTNKVDALIYENELPIILDKVAKYQKQKKTKKVTTAWLQKEFQIGYAHAARLLDVINRK